MILLLTLFLAAAPAPQKPNATDAGLAFHCAAYLSLGLGEAEAEGRLDGLLRRQFEAWFKVFEGQLAPSVVSTAGASVAYYGTEVDREDKTLRAAHTAWCRQNAPLESAA